MSFRTRHLFGLAAVTGSLQLIDAGQLVVAAPATGSSVIGGRRRPLPSPPVTPSATNTSGRPTSWARRTNPTDRFRTTESLRGEGDKWLLSGTLTAAGVRAPLELIVTGTRLEGPTVIISATGSVDRYAHGLVKMKEHGRAPAGADHLRRRSPRCRHERPRVRSPVGDPGRSRCPRCGGRCDSDQRLSPPPAPVWPRRRPRSLSEQDHLAALYKAALAEGGKLTVYAGGDTHEPAGSGEVRASWPSSRRWT